MKKLRITNYELRGKFNVLGSKFSSIFKFSNFQIDNCHLSIINYQLLVFFILFVITSCKVDDTVVEESTGYSQEIGSILLTKCAVSGCHTDKSKEAAAGLSLETWDKMMQGGNNGAVTIPFNHGQSTAFLFTNTYSDLGASVSPTMPVGGDPLSKNEVITLRDWIDGGAPNRDGIIKFSDNRSRKKIYITNQGCDLVAVVDEQTNLIMRYVSVGNSENVEGPHMVRVSPDGKYWYVVFINSTVMQKFNAIDDSYVEEVEIGYGSWNTMTISKDSKTAFAVDWEANGQVACVDLETMTLKKLYKGSNLFIYPHGSTLNDSATVLYLTAQTGNFIYKVNITDINFPDIEEISMVPGEAPSSVSSLDAHDIILSPDQTKYFVTCQKSNEVRVMDAKADTLITVIPVGIYPSEFALSLSNNYLFISCTEDTIQFPSLGRGCISVIDYVNNTLVKNIFSGYQPHGLSVDDNNQYVYVANRNATSGGIAPHHTTECGGRDGYLTLIDMSTLELSDFKTELSVDPYSVAVR